MNSLLQNLVTASVVGTIVFLILLAIRPVTGRVFSKTWHYYMGFVPLFFFLGGVVVVNMLMPSFGFNLSALTQGDIALPATLTTTAIGYYPPMYTASSLINSEAVVGYSDVFVNAQTHPQPVVLRQLVYSLHLFRGWILGLVSSSLPVHTWAFIAIAWLVGSVTFLYTNLRTYFVFRKGIFKHSRPHSYYQDSINIVVSSKATTPMLVGFIRPTIVLPDIALTDSEIKMILAHELAHLRRKDTWLKLAILITRAVHWLNPVVHMLGRYIYDLCELSCDEKIVADMQARERKQYGQLILSILQHSTNRHNNMVCASSLCTSQENIRRRLTNMLNTKKSKKLVLALSLVAALIITGLSSVVAHALSNGQAVDDNMYTVTADKLIPAGEVINDNIHVQRGNLQLMGRVNGIITVASGASLTVSGDGLVYGTVVVYGSLQLSDNATITGMGTRGVIVNSGGYLYMLSGYIRGNSYAGSGGGVWINGGAVTMRGGRITENIAGGGGGGVWIDGANSALTMYAGFISNNHSYYPGGGILADGGRPRITILGGEVIDNTISVPFEG